MSTEAITASITRTYEEYQRNSSSSSGGSSLDIDAFLELFVAQLSNQDPLGGSSGSSGGTDYISQLAQLTMLQQLSTLDDAISTSQAYSMIGKYVYIGKNEDSDMIFGRVDGVINDNGVNRLMVGGKAYDMSEMYAVIDDDTVSAGGDGALKYANLIGKTVTATVTGEDDEEITVTGKVNKILIQDDTYYLVVDGKIIEFDDIIEINESEPETTKA